MAKLIYEKIKDSQREALYLMTPEEIKQAEYINKITKEGYYSKKR